jgi:glutaminyl-tRNA synthetase
MTAEPTPGETPAAPSDFIRDIVAEDLARGRHAGVVTRFPPEPNGYLHIGHAKSICLNFGIAREHGGRCNLRFDDTNPVSEEDEYVRGIITDVRWLIDGWADRCLGFKSAGAVPEARTVDGRTDYRLEGAADGEPFHASDYFDALYFYAEELIRRGHAYVCDLSPKETEEYRGAPDRPGRESPWRNRSADESLDLFRRMRAGEFPDGARSLRARIDMASPNIWLRDPLLYRIRHIAHHHAGDRWCIYPLYDFAHCLSDYIEGITHSICTLEFEVHRPLYDWILESLDLVRPLPHQYEFAKLILSYCVFSKRRLAHIVRERAVAGWDDPRLPTLAGVRRRGIPASALRRLATMVGVTKYDSLTDYALFEHCVRDELNTSAARRLAVLRPLRLVLENIPAGDRIECRALDNPQDESPTSRAIYLTREVFIESDDFAEVPPPKFFRLKPGGEVRLKYGCIVRCDRVEKDADGHISALYGTADLDTRTGGSAADRKVKGTIHWVSAEDAIPMEVRLYDRLFTVPDPAADEDFMKHLNPHSLETVRGFAEPTVGGAAPGQAFQFERLGYFAADPVDSRQDSLVFNRTIGLKDTWAKATKK